jgi:CubicO group peptidase (beta-lactamase class C family)
MTKRRPCTTRATLAVLTSALVLAGCSTGLQAGPAAPAAPSVPVDASAPNPATAAVALPEGSIDEALSQLPMLAESIRVQSGVPGLAVAVVHGGQTVYSAGFGTKRSGEDDPIDPETVFQVASMSKPIGATVVATQVSQEVVGWDTPLRTHLKGFALADPWVSRHATIGDAYAHRTGLPHAAGDLLEDIGHRRPYVLKHLRDLPLEPFRTTYNYANYGTTAGAASVARAAGTSWSRLSEQELYEPLGMTSTSSRHRDFLARDNRATLHARVDGRFQALHERDPDPQSPAGGVSTNVVDVAAWMKMVLAGGQVDGKPFIDAEALAPAIRPQMINSVSTDVTARAGTYGFGFNVGVQPGGRVSLGHSGAFVLGAGTSFTMIPSVDIGIVTLTNGAPVGVPEALNAEFMDLVQFGHITRDWRTAYRGALASATAPEGDLVGEEPPTDPAAAGSLARYTGTYANHHYGKAVVRLRQGHLEVAMGRGGQYRFRLDHWDGPIFSFVPTGETAPDGSLSSATFKPRKEGRAATLTLEFFDRDGLGTWVRR